ncbi:hypothetical protein K457DRAFT_1875197 [Linnemannia elongata AG-77]|uniref:Uncharacterized protein n=1 Tax=Linnemannia elongata AG-77 TaxID=1314771 RepID=A0A197K1D7_9FUNG|nr:hypothetical protein K457DRAFT_1875197 [Linnemannia elongata AG-77]
MLDIIQVSPSESEDIELGSPSTKHARLKSGIPSGTSTPTGFEFVATLPARFRQTSVLNSITSSLTVLTVAFNLLMDSWSRSNVPSRSSTTSLFAKADT